MDQGRIQVEPRQVHEIKDSWELSPWDEGVSWMQNYRLAKSKTQNLTIPNRPTTKPKTLKRLTQPATDVRHLQRELSTISSPRFKQATTHVLRLKQFNSCHDNTNNSTKFSHQNRLHNALQNIAKQISTGSAVGYLSKKIQPIRQKVSVESRYAKWKNKLEMIAKTKKKQNSSPRLPKIQICWF